MRSSMRMLLFGISANEKPAYLPRPRLALLVRARRIGPVYASVSQAAPLPRNHPHGANAVSPLTCPTPILLPPCLARLLAPMCARAVLVLLPAPTMPLSRHVACRYALHVWNTLHLCPLTVLHAAPAHASALHNLCKDNCPHT